MSRILVVGSLNVDYVAFVPRFPRPGETLAAPRVAVHPGGKGANQAFAAARLGGVVRMIGKVGSDPQGTWLRSRLAGAGVDVDAIDHDADQPTGVALITIDPAGQNTIVIGAGANAGLSIDQLTAGAGLFGRGDVVLLQLESPMEVVLASARLARRAGCRVLLDPAPAGPVSDELLGLADYVTPNETELSALTGSTGHASIPVEAAVGLGQRLLARGAKRIIVKLGAAGAVLVTPDGHHHWPAFPVNVVDTTAAGDAFNAAYAVAMAEGQDDVAAGRFACAAASCSVTREGAQAAMPDRAEVERLIGSL